MANVAVDYFKPFLGKQMLEDFSTAIDEPEIEDLYKDIISHLSDPSIRIVKRGFVKTKEKTDGLIEFRYKNGKLFYALQEVKYKKAYTDLQLKYQLLQALVYNYRFSQETPYDFRVYILNSEKYFAYVFADEIEEIIKDLSKLFPKMKECASKAYENKLVNAYLKNCNITFHKDLITDEYQLHNTLRTIYKHCL